MEKSIVFMFSGQGSQYDQMGKDMYFNNPSYEKWITSLDKIVSGILGKSIIDTLYIGDQNKDKGLNGLLFTHLAIFMLEYSMARVLIEMGIKPDYVLGTSLGEFASIAVAGVIGVEDVIHLVIKQAQEIERSCRNGSMLAIVHDPIIYYNSCFIYENSELVSVNFDSHFVISGETNNIYSIESHLRSNGITTFKLPVEYAFHSRLIDPAGFIYKEFLKGRDYKTSEIPIVSCLHGDIISNINESYLWDIARKPIKFIDAIKVLEKKKDCIYIDLGPSGTLANFARKNLSKNSISEVYPIILPFGKSLDKLNEIKNILGNKCLIKRKERGSRMLTYVFPGQGAQQKGMGGSLFDEFKELVSKADEILGYSIKELCLEDPQQLLGDTRYTQPAMYVVSALSYLSEIKKTGIEPQFLAGHSLGEYNALFASGAFDFETGLKLVKVRGELMSQALGGGMAAIIGLDREHVEKVLHDNNLESIDIANLNSPFQIVISGPKKDIEHSKPIFEQTTGVKMVAILKTSGAFHSRYMEDSKISFEKFINNFEFNEFKIPVISNVNARPYKLTEIKQNLAKQITHPVQWSESIRYLLGCGEMEFEEIGVGKVLTSLIKRIKTEAQPLVIDTQPNNSFKEQPVSNNIENSKLDSYLSEEKQMLSGKKGFLSVSLGSSEFKDDYNLRFAYLTGGMYRGISSKELVVKIAKCGMMGFFGTGGLELPEIEEAILYIQKELDGGKAYGFNLTHSFGEPRKEEKIVELYLANKVRVIEAAAFMTITPALVKFRAKGLKLDSNGKVLCSNKIIAKVSRPEVGEAFLSPAPKRVVAKLISENQITEEEATLLKQVPMCDDICAEADSGGHTDGAVAYALMPAIIKLRDEMMHKYGYYKKVRVGTAGGIGTPQAAAAAFILGADFIMTGSINQCTVEAATSKTAKNLLQQINVQDTEYVPAGDMFETGAKIQVLRKGVFFPARANKLYSLYSQYNSLDEIDTKIKAQIQEKYFKCSFEEVYESVKSQYSEQEIGRAERNPKYKMALIFKRYFSCSSNWALTGNEEFIVDYQIYCGPALGAFNQWVKGTELEHWEKRHVDEIGIKIMTETAKLLNGYFDKIVN